MSNIALKYQFEQWIMTLESSSLSDIQKKFLNLLINYFDTIFPLGINGGARAKKIGWLIENNHETLSTAFPNLNSRRTNSERVSRIDELVIGPFRGFSTKESFVFDKKYTFMYGPNGSGKSSFCEGLEYALLDSIEEAESKRIRLGTYIQNTQNSYSVRPKVYRLDEKKQKVEVPPNSAVYRFSFVEKNRIDGFARITATTASNQKDRIATLFGLDAFSDFVDKFTDNFDSRYITLINQKEENFKAEAQKIELSEKRVIQLDADMDNHVESAEILINEVAKEGISSLNDLKNYLVGEDDVSGIINDLHEKKAENIPDNLKFYTIDLLFFAVSKIRADLGILTTELERLWNISSEVNYKNLYSAIESIAQDATTDKSICPACKTSIANVFVNPFENAASELAKLGELSALQNRIEELGGSLSKQVRKASSISIKEINTLKATISNQDRKIPEFTEFDYISIATIENWKVRLEKELVDIEKEFQNTESLYTDLHNYNATLQQRRAEKDTIDAALRKYQGFKIRYDDIVAAKKTLTEQKDKLQTEIKSFYATNESKLQEIKGQKEKIEINKQYLDAYCYLISKLKAYRNNLPVQLAEGLSDRVRDYYNTINGHDPDFEKLGWLSLPTAPEQKISISFQGDGRPHDALLILSEGHIKVLGLSILLAKAVKENLGFLIFDDIVNAIDDDHRGGIAELLLNHPDLKDRQHIITCHGPDFINKLEHKLGASTASKDVRSYRFVPPDSVEERGVRISVGDSKHYLLIAKEALERDNRKDVASNCRRAMESISEQLWIKLGKTLNINLTVKMRAPGNSPDLSTVVDSLTKAVKVIEGLQELHNELKQLKEKYPWSLLNKGVHEQGNLPEFDREDVSDLLTLVLSIEEKVSAVK